MNILIYGDNNYATNIKENIRDYSIKHIKKGDYKKNQDLTILVNMDVKKNIDVNEYCREINKKFISVNFSHMEANIFMDLSEHTMHYPVIDDINILNISSSGIVECIHEFKSSDIIHIDGIKELERDWLITVINSNSFQLHDFNKTDFKFINATCRYSSKGLIRPYKPYYYNDKTLILDNNNNNIFTNIITIIIKDMITKIFNKKYLDGNQWINIKCPPLKNINNNYPWILHQNNILISKILKEFNIKNTIITKVDSTLSEQKISGIVNTTNNTEQLLIDTCFKNNITLLDYRTHKNKGSTIMMVPFKTSSKPIDNIYTEPTYPACVINSFPNRLEHCNEWAKEIFEFFRRAPKTYKMWKENPNCLDTMGEIEKTIALNDIKCYDYKPREYAINMFNKYYYHNIIDLINTFKDNPDYWVGAKRKPSPTLYNMDNHIHNAYIDKVIELLENIPTDIDNTYIYIAASLRAFNYNINNRITTINNHNLNNIVENIMVLSIMYYSVEEYYNFKIDMDKYSISYTKAIESIKTNNIDEWTKYIHTKDIKLIELKKQYELIFNTNITMIACGSSMIYAEFMGDTSNLDKMLSELNDSKKYDLTLCSDDDIDIPLINVNIC